MGSWRMPPRPKSAKQARLLTMAAGVAVSVGMRLGWLSRLGIVLTAFGVPIVTVVSAGRQYEQLSESRQALYELCMSLAEDDPPDRIGKSMEACWNERFNRPMQTDHFWTNGLGFAAMLAAIGWILGALLYWSGRWVLAGRQPKPARAPSAEHP